MICGFWDGGHWRSKEDEALWRLDGAPKPAAEIWKQLVLDTWTSKIKSKTNKNGEHQARIYTGKYKITVIHKGQTKTVTTVVTNSGNEVHIKM